MDFLTITFGVVAASIFAVVAMQRGARLEFRPATEGKRDVSLWADRNPD